MANPYQTRSFGSTFVLGHEIGHSLGMRHDDYLGCDKVYIAHCALSLDSLMHPTTIYTVTYQNVTNLLYNMNPLKFLWFFWSRKYRISKKHFSRLSAPNSLFTGSSLKKLFWCLFTSARTRPLFAVRRPCAGLQNNTNGTITRFVIDDFLQNCAEKTKNIIF